MNEVNFGFFIANYLEEPAMTEKGTIFTTRVAFKFAYIYFKGK
jgi:hypothetical protein